MPPRKRKLTVREPFSLADNPERGALLQLIRTALGLSSGAGAAGSSNILPDRLDWTKFSQLVLDQGVVALVGHSLDLAPGNIPAELTDAFQTFVASQRADNEKRSSAFAQIIGALNQADIQVIPIKGPLLAQTAYGDLGLRTFWDFDFLFPATKISELTDALEALGFVQEVILPARQMQAYWAYSGQAVFRRQADELCLEPHTCLTPSTLAIDLDYEGIWQRAFPANWRGTQILRLTPEDEFIMLCVHGAKEAWWKLKYIADLAFFLKSQPDLDWKTVFERARSQGLLRLVTVALLVMRKTLNYPIPSLFRTQGGKDATARKLAINICNAPFPGVPASIYNLSRYYLDLREKISDKIRYVWRTVTTPREAHFNSILIPDRWFFLYTPVKVLHDGIALPLWKRLRPLFQRNHD